MSKYWYFPLTKPHLLLSRDNSSYKLTVYNLEYIFDFFLSLDQKLTIDGKKGLQWMIDPLVSASSLTGNADSDQCAFQPKRQN